MIEPMEKILIGCRQGDEKRLLRLLRQCGTVHIKPADVRPGADASELLSRRDSIQRAIAIVNTVDQTLPTRRMPPDDVAMKIIAVEKSLRESEVIRDALQMQIENQLPLGNVSQKDLQAFATAGLAVSFWWVSVRQLNELTGVPHVVLKNQGIKNNVAVMIEGHHLPQLSGINARPIPLPEKNIQELKYELNTLDRRREDNLILLKQLASHLPALRARLRSIDDTLSWQKVLCTAVHSESISAFSGWAPSVQKKHIIDTVKSAKLALAIQFTAPQTGEQPPTLWQPHEIARPMRALFRILGTTPGYDESDVSLGFMAALPVFCALLIADGGYGLLLAIVALLGIRKVSGQAPKEAAQLVLIIGIAATLWGFMIASFFGFDPGALSKHTGWLAWVPGLLNRFRLFDGTLSDTHVVNQMIAVSFVLGTLHMTVARFWRGWRALPSMEALAQLGWILIIWGMLMLANRLVLGAPQSQWMIPLLCIGAALVAIFTKPQERLFKRLLQGISALPLGALGVLSDTISYIRLMAVGLASTILGATFNMLAAEIAEVSLLLAAVVFVLGHSLNIALAMVALFAHGVRLNMLEFSNHLGMGWTGYPYIPFRIAQKEN